MCTVFILLHYFGTRIAHLINILENRPIICIMLNAFANLLYVKLCWHTVIGATFDIIEVRGTL